MIVRLSMCENVCQFTIVLFSRVSSWLCRRWASHRPWFVVWPLRHSDDWRRLLEIRRFVVFLWNCNEKILCRYFGSVMNDEKHEKDEKYSKLTWFEFSAWHRWHSTASTSWNRCGTLQVVLHTRWHWDVYIDTSEVSAVGNTSTLVFRFCSHLHKINDRPLFRFDFFLYLDIDYLFDYDLSAIFGTNSCERYPACSLRHGR